MFNSPYGQQWEDYMGMWVWHTYLSRLKSLQCNTVITHFAQRLRVTQEDMMCKPYLLGIGQKEKNTARSSHYISTKSKRKVRAQLRILCKANSNTKVLKEIFMSLMCPSPASQSPKHLARIANSHRDGLSRVLHGSVSLQIKSHCNVMFCSSLLRSLWT